MTNSVIKFTPEVDKIINSTFATNTNQRLALDYGLNIGGLVKLVLLQNDIYHKKVNLSDLETEIATRKIVPKAKVKVLAIDLLVTKFLILDDIWFEGQVTQELKKYGVNVADQAKFLADFREAVANEKIDFSEDEVASKAETEKPKNQKEYDPEEEKRSIKTVFSNNLVDLLKLEDYRAKFELNSRLSVLFLTFDKEKSFYNDLMSDLYENKEILTITDIKLNNETLTGTVGNWLKDYIHYVGVDEVVNTIKKAQYFINSKNIQQLDQAQKDLIDKLLDFYINLKNFHKNSERLSLDDLEILPYTEKEFEQKSEYLINQNIDKEPTSSVDLEKPFDLDNLDFMSAEDSNQLNQIKTDIIAKTRQESNKVADILEEALLRRKKFEILACLDVLATTGALDDLLVKDVRFKQFVLGYLKRNQLQDEIEEFKEKPYQEKFVKYFLKFVFNERLGFSIEVGARFAARLAEIFREAGLSKYSQIAYFDLADNKFKWND